MSDDQLQPELTTTSTDVEIEMDTPTDVQIGEKSEGSVAEYVLGENEQFVVVNGRKLVEVLDPSNGCTYHKTNELGNLLVF